MRTRHAIALAALAASGCTWGPSTPVEVSSVGPVTVTRGVKTIVSVRGDGFLSDVVIDFDDPADSAACGRFRVELRAPDVNPVPPPVQLGEVWVASATELRARLEGDAGKATWDIVVIDEGGGEVTLPGAIDVTNCEGSLNTQCDDGEPCTYDPTFGTLEDGLDKCTGNSACVGSSHVADGTACLHACASGEAVGGSCRDGSCVPDPGLCDAHAACNP